MMHDENLQAVRKAGLDVALSSYLLMLRQAEGLPDDPSYATVEEAVVKHLQDLWTLCEGKME